MRQINNITLTHGQETKNKTFKSEGAQADLKRCITEGDSGLRRSGESRAKNTHSAQALTVQQSFAEGYSSG